MANNLFKLDGLADLQRQLKGLASEKTAIKVQRCAATAAIRPMRREAKSLCPVHEGGLEKSIDSKVSARGMHVSALVGSDTSVMQAGAAGEYFKKKAKEPEPVGAVRAARHLHLVLFGHIDSAGRFYRGDNFLETAYEDTISTCLGIYAAKAKEGIEMAAEDNK